MLGSEDIINTTDRCMMRSRLHQLGIRLCLFRYLTHHGDESIDGILRLVFCRLYHQTLMEEQRKVDGRCMIAVVK